MIQIKNSKFESRVSRFETTWKRELAGFRELTERELRNEWSQFSRISLYHRRAYFDQKIIK